jgi:oligopeptide transport system substrate-binding protein
MKLPEKCHSIGLFAILLLAINCAFAAADPSKVLRVASPDIETLDPQQTNDQYSADIIRAIFEGLYEWDYLASPTHLAPLTAAALPEISNDGRTWSIQLKPGIFFTDDPAFGGKHRELVAEDYVYSYKRWLDPTLRRGGDSLRTDLIVGARAVVDAARQPGGKFDYDRPIEGLRAIGKYTLQIRLEEPGYPLIETMLAFVAVAREVVEFYQGDIRTHAVGTGPFRLKEWKRGSRMVLEANRDYRTLRFPSTADPVKATLTRGMQGKSYPQIGAVEVSFIDEELPRILAFERGELDYVMLRSDTANRLLANGKLKAAYATRGIRHNSYVEPNLWSLYFNLEDPLVGGMSKEQVGFRRAIALGLNIGEVIDVVFGGQATPANQLIPPGVAGHDKTLPRSVSYDPMAANALLDRVGYNKRDREGYRQTPEGKPLTLTLSLRTGVIFREFETLWKKNMAALGLRTEFREAPLQDMFKELNAGKFQIYFGGYGGSPSGYLQVWQLSSKQSRTVNPMRFSLAVYDQALDRFMSSPTGLSQVAAARTMSELARTYVPLIPVVFRLDNDYVHPWVGGYQSPIFFNYWKYLDLDLARRNAAGK